MTFVAYPIWISVHCGNRPNHLCCVEHLARVVFSISVEIDDPSCIPLDKDSKAEVKVPRSLHIEANWMCCCPFILGLPVSPPINISTAMLILTVSPAGMGPHGGMVGVFPMSLHRLAKCLTAAWASVVVTAPPNIASKFGQHSNMTYMSSKDRTSK